MLYNKDSTMQQVVHPIWMDKNQILCEYKFCIHCFVMFLCHLGRVLYLWCLVPLVFFNLSLTHSYFILQRNINIKYYYPLSLLSNRMVFWNIANYKIRWCNCLCNISSTSKYPLEKYPLVTHAIQTPLCVTPPPPACGGIAQNFTGPTF